jgi:chemotaxis protein MotB
MQDVLANNPRLAALRSQIRLDMTPDGLRIQIVDEQSRAMFDSGSAIVKPYMRELLHQIAQVLAEVPNRLTLEGHTDAAPFGAGERGYSNWELSSDRANASRRELVAGGLPEQRMLRVQGLASSALYERNDPLSPVNRRISIIVMNREAEDNMLRSSPEFAAESAEAGASSPMPAAGLSTSPVSAR